MKLNCFYILFFILILVVFIKCDRNKIVPKIVVTQCDTLAISFSNRIMPIIQNSCVGCHNSSMAGGGYDLSSYNEIIKSIDPLIGSIKHLSGYSEMPKGSQKLDDCSINVIQKWIDAGHKNN